MTLEREDIGANSNDPLLVPMHPVAAPYGEARDDYAILAGLAERLGSAEAFTENRSVRQWLEHLYEPTRAALAAMDLPAPSFDEFWNSEGYELPSGPTMVARCAPFARIRTASRCRRRAASSRSFRKRSRALAKPTAPATRPGSGQPTYPTAIPR
jgi:anaerobic selenocysteine-containing dehydrogenase